MMIYLPDPDDMRRRAKEIINARNWGVGIVTALLGVGMFASEARRILSIEPDLMGYAYLVLFAATGILVFLWIWATQRELDLLFEYLDPEHYNPPSTVKETLLILTVAVLLVSLLFASRNPLWFSVVFTTYSVVMVPLTLYMNPELARAFREKQASS